MRPLIQLTTQDLEGIRFMALNLFDSNGQHADQIVKPADDLDIIEAVITMRQAHRIFTIDVQTDSESIFKAFLAVPGVNVMLVLPSELRALQELFMPESAAYPMIRDLFIPEVDTLSDEKLTLWQRILKFIGGLIRRCKR